MVCERGLVVSEKVVIEEGKCGACDKWKLKGSPLAKHGLGNCEWDPRWTYRGMSWTCERFEAAQRVTVDKRIQWLTANRFRLECPF